MTKLLKLLLAAYIKKVVFIIMVSLISTFAVKFITGENNLSYELIFCCIYIMISLSMLVGENPFKNNLSWLLTTSSSRSEIIWSNFTYRFFQLFFIYIIPALVLFAESVLFNRPVSSAVEFLKEDQTIFHFHHISSSLLITIILFVIINISFLFSLGSARVFGPRKNHRASIYGYIILLLGFLILEYYDFSSLVLWPFVSIFIFAGILFQFKRYNLLPKIKLPQIATVSFALALVYFASIKFYSDQLIRSPQISLELKIDEINFQNKLGSFLNTERLVEMLRNPVDYARLRPLVALYPAQNDLKSTLKTEIETTFRSIIESKKDWTSVEFMLSYYDAGDLKEKDLSLVLDHMRVIEPKRDKVSQKLVKWFEKSQMKRHDLLNFLASSNPLKQYIAVSMARSNQFDLQQEILKNIDHFTNPTIELVGKMFSKNNCRTISSVELFKASSKRQFNLQSNCKKVKVD